MTMIAPAPVQTVQVKSEVPKVEVVEPTPQVRGQHGALRLDFGQYGSSNKGSPFQTEFDQTANVGEGHHLQGKALLMVIGSIMAGPGGGVPGKPQSAAYSNALTNLFYVIGKNLGKSPALRYQEANPKLRENLQQLAGQGKFDEATRAVEKEGLPEAIRQEVLVFIEWAKKALN